MTIEELRKSDQPVVRPVDIAGILGVHPFAICIKAREGTLEFPYFRSGNRTKIPRIPFLNWLEGRE